MHDIMWLRRKILYNLEENPAGTTITAVTEAICGGMFDASVGAFVVDFLERGCEIGVLRRGRRQHFQVYMLSNTGNDVRAALLFNEFDRT